MRNWFAVHTQPRNELLARRHLENQGFGVYLPRYLKWRSHARRREQVMAPLFPSYLFVNIDIDRARWRAIHSTVGVKRLVCQGDRPVPVPDTLIDEIRAREDDNGRVILGKMFPFKRGDKLRFVAGPLIDQIGLFDCKSDEERVYVLLNVLGREIRVRMPIEAVSICA